MKPSALLISCRLWDLRELEKLLFISFLDSCLTWCLGLVWKETHSWDYGNTCGILSDFPSYFKNIWVHTAELICLLGRICRCKYFLFALPPIYSAFPNGALWVRIRARYVGFCWLRQKVMKNHDFSYRDDNLSPVPSFSPFLLHTVKIVYLSVLILSI